MAVCGDPTSRHGIILAKNEPAKKYGVQTAETIWQARKKCPDLVLLPPHHGLYRQVSKQVNAIYEQYTDLVEPFGIDESWLDVTDTLHLFGGDAKALADTLRERIKRELGLTLSVGVSFNKVFAKLGSDYKKPDATTVISRENWQKLVWPLPVGALLYVGGAAQKLLAQYGVETIGQLAACRRDALETLMGKMGAPAPRLRQRAGPDPVRSRYERGAGEVRGQRHHLSPEPHHRGPGPRRHRHAGGLRGHPAAARRAVRRRHPGDGAGPPVPRPLPPDAAARPHPSDPGADGRRPWT